LFSKRRPKLKWWQRRSSDLSRIYETMEKNKWRLSIVGIMAVMVLELSINLTRYFDIKFFPLKKWGFAGTRSRALRLIFSYYPIIVFFTLIVFILFCFVKIKWSFFLTVFFFLEPYCFVLYKFTLVNFAYVVKFFSN
jgi:hypothetical protein